MRILRETVFWWLRARLVVGNARDASARLGALGDARALKPLVKALKSWDEGVGIAAANALGVLGDARAVDQLIEVLSDPLMDLHRGDAKELRSAAAMALGRIGDCRAVAPLVEALERNSGDTQQAAATALGKLGDARAVGPLVNVLGAENATVRKAAVEALRRLGHPEWTTWVHGDGKDWSRLGESRNPRCLVPLLKALSWPTVMEYAAHALGTLGDAHAIEPLVQHLTGSYGCNQGAAANALVKLGEGGGVDEVIRALSHSSEMGKQAAAYALGNSGDVRAVNPLINALEDSSTHVRAGAAEALGRLGDDRAVAPLIRSLGDDDGGVRRTAATALRELGHPAWVERVKGDAGDWTRLGESGDPVSLEPLSRAFNHQWGQDVAIGLVKAGGTRALDPLIHALRNGQIERVADALVILGDPRAVEPLIEALGTEPPKQRRAAAAALKQLGHPEWSIWVEGDSDDWKRLGESGDRRASVPLLKALRNFHTQKAAAQALLRLGDASVVPTVAAIWREGAPEAAIVLRSLGWQPPNVGEQARLAFECDEHHEASRLAGIAVQPLLKRLEVHGTLHQLPKDEKEATVKELIDVGPAALPYLVQAFLEGVKRTERELVVVEWGRWPMKREIAFFDYWDPRYEVYALASVMHRLLYSCHRRRGNLSDCDTRLLQEALSWKYKKVLRDAILAAGGIYGVATD